VAERQESAGLEPRPGRPGSDDGSGLLPAIERIGAEVTSLTRLVSAQPEEVAARVGFDAATSAVAVRIGAFGSALDQLRLSLLAGLDRNAERLDQPTWLPDLLDALGTLAARLDHAVADLPSRDGFLAAIAATDPSDRLTRLEATLAATDPTERLTRLEATLAAIAATDPSDGLTRLEATLAASDPGPRLARLEATLSELGEAARTDAAATAGLLAAQPEQLTDHLATATGAVTTRIAVLGAALDQLRISLLGGLDHATERIDQPPWLPALQERMDELTAASAETGPDPVLVELGAQQARLTADPRLDDLAVAIAELATELRAGVDEASALDGLGARLGAIEAANARAAEDALVLAERVAPLPDRLGAIAAQLDRLTPLARAGDEVGSLVGRLDRLGASLDQVMARLSATTDAGPRPEGADGERLDGVVEALTGVARRQDEVTAAVASVLDQAQGPRSVDAVLDRLEQRERSLVARLDRIDAGLRSRTEGPGSATGGAERPDAAAERALRAVLDAVEGQGTAFAARLDRLDGQVRSLAARPAPDASPPGPPLDTVLRRLDEQEQTMARQLDWVGDRLAEVAAHLLPRQADESIRSGSGPAPDERLEMVVEALAGIARRQDQLATRFSALAAQRQVAPAPPPLPAPTKEAAERRLAKLRAERAEVKVRLEQERLLAARAWEGDPFDDGFDDEETV